MLKAYYNRGIVYAAKGDLDNAISDYTEVIRLNPDDAKAYFNRGVAQLGLRKWEEAKSDLTSARNMEVDISATFHDGNVNVEEFEKAIGIQLPAEIASMLTPP